MLVDEHPDGDSAHVEAVQEVLDAVLCSDIRLVGLLQLDYTLRHSLHYVRVTVPDFDQSVAEPESNETANETHRATQF